MTITDAVGAMAVQVVWFFNPTTRALVNNPAPWTDGDGTVWPTGSGALIGVNVTDHQVVTVVRDAGGAVIRRVTLPPDGGHPVKAAVLAAQTPPDGPFTSADDFNGMSFSLAG